MAGLGRMHRITTFAVALVVGCGVTGRYIPPSLKGDTPLAVENLSAGPVCRFWVTEPGSTQTPANLLYSTLRGDMPLQVAEKATFKLKPGTYEVGVASCSAGLETTQTLSLTGPTYVGLGRPGTPPPGYASITLAGNSLQLCTMAGGSMDDGRPCCSKQHHHTNSGDVCD